MIVAFTEPVFEQAAVTSLAARGYAHLTALGDLLLLSGDVRAPE